MSHAARKDMHQDPAVTSATSRPRRLSEVLAELVQSGTTRVSVGQLVDGLADRGHAALMILFAVPNLLPLPPGSSTILGVPLALIAAQLAFARAKPWLPTWLRRRSLDRATFAAIAGRTAPHLARFERLARPRYWLFPNHLADRAVGLAVLVMAVILILPIPFANLAASVTVILAALGLAERDGLWVGLAALAAAASIGLAFGVLLTVGFVANRWLF